MFCPNCGSQNADNVAFCASCGQPLAGGQPAAPVAQPVAQPVYTAAPAYPAYPAAPASVPGKGMGIASMILGIISLVLFCYLYVSIPCALVGCILGGIGLKKAKDAGMKNGMAVAGLVCSIIAIAVCVIFGILLADALASLSLL